MEIQSSPMLLEMYLMTDVTVRRGTGLNLSRQFIISSHNSKLELLLVDKKSLLTLKADVFTQVKF